MTHHKLVIAEKPSVAQSIAAVLGATKRNDGYLSGNGYLVSWCFGHLAELAGADVYDEKYAKWRYDDLPILPASWRFTLKADKAKQFELLRDLMRREDVTEVINACDAGRGRGRTGAARHIPVPDEGPQSPFGWPRPPWRRSTAASWFSCSPPCSRRCGR